MEGREKGRGKRGEIENIEKEEETGVIGEGKEDRVEDR